MKGPTPKTIFHARNSIGLSTEQAANLVYATKRSWEYWESGERSMSPAVWELFLMKISGTIPRKYADEPRSVVVILGDDGEQFIDVVADDNFVDLQGPEDSPNAVISSLAVEHTTGRPYVHKTTFKRAVNQHVLEAVSKWKGQFSS
ncbi:helix-turn-helix domain-containing protein [Pantoea stewartii]|uniref:helix-turn-helix domain-containing protein n=1 Tax=Pantoea stewartii TaxID=66269 RepID=UPI000534E3C8|nr:helix-turn-helix domain-containing protein [Pantoea stewartii]